MVDKGYRLMMLKGKKPCKVIEDLEGAGVLGRPSPNKKKRPSGLDDSRVSKSGSFLLSHLV